MKIFTIEYYVGEDKYWTEIEADTIAEARTKFFESIMIYNIEE